MEKERYKITVSEPQVNTDSTLPYVSYLVSGYDLKGPFSTRRRYRDFHLLREKIVERWPGLYVPPISSKKVAVKIFLFRETHKISLYSSEKNS